MTAPFPAWYKPEAKCEFQFGAEGHTIENCKAVKYKFQELIDQKVLTFKEAGPNVKGNPLPGHPGAGVNQVSSAEELTRDASMIKTPLASIKETLISYDQFLNMHYECKVCEEDPNQCIKMRDCLQKLMDQGLLHIGYARKESMVAMVDQHEHEKVLRPIEIVYQKVEVEPPVENMEPLVVQVPTPFPFKSINAVPWN
jgi:hypothetical protein